MKIPAIFVTSLLVWGLVEGRAVVEEVSASASSSASSSVSTSLGGGGGGGGWSEHGGSSSSKGHSHVSVIKASGKEGGLSYAQGASVNAGALGDTSLDSTVRLLNDVDLGLDWVANGLERVAAAQASATTKAKVAATGKRMVAIRATERVGDLDREALAWEVKGNKAIQGQMAAATNALGATAAMRAAAVELNKVAKSTMESRVKANADSVLTKKALGTALQIALQAAAKAARAKEDLLRAEALAVEAAAKQASITQDLAQVIVLATKIKGVQEKAAAAQQIATSESSAAVSVHTSAAADAAAEAADAENKSVAAVAAAAAEKNSADEVAEWVKMIIKKLESLKGSVSSKSSGNVWSESSASASASSGAVSEGWGHSGAVAETSASASAGASASAH
ncbi:hypothetical protein KM043_001388 [Ampulex compressa]|nr:hypothetical protein KM043_001388 [Ampulex compressa]